MTPWDEGFKRAAWNAGTTFAVAFVITLLAQYQMALGQAGLTEFERIRNSVIAALLVALAPFATGLNFAKSDQARADVGLVQPSDVPIAIGARNSGRSPVEVAGDFAPGKLAA